MQILACFGALWAVLCLATSEAPAQRQLEQLATVSPPSTATPAPGGAAAIVLADLNGDGLPDMVVAKSGDANRIYLNDTTGYLIDFTAALLPDVAEITESIAAGDVDGDGHCDLVFGNSPLLTGSGGQNRLYLNNGTGRFSDVTSTEMPANASRTTAMALGDVDGDGDLDLVCGNSRFVGFGGPLQQNRLYVNDGNGSFTDVTATQLPLDNDDTLAVALCDVDGDGDADLVCGNSDLSGARAATQNRLYLNDGAGNFTDVTGARMPADTDDTQAVAFGDVDGDGSPDLVFGNGSYSGSATASRQNRLYLNTGEGVFWDPTATKLPVDTGCTSAVALDDVDADGDLDIVTGNSDIFVLGCPRQDGLYLNDGTGIFSDASNQLVPRDDDTTCVALGDLDGDGDADLIAGDANIGGASTQHRVFVNDGAGTFANQPGRSSMSEVWMPSTSETTRDIALGDIDGDGDVDALVANQGQNSLLVGDGSGVLSIATAQLPIDAEQSQDVALCDIDADGDLDAIVANHGQNALYVNDGTGTFSDVTAAQLPVDTDASNSVAVADVDGDGDRDLMFGNGMLPPSGGVEQNRLYVNDGAGTFTDVTATQLPVGMAQTRAVILVDVDGDGDLDAVLANNLQNQLLVNDGAGVFTDVTATQLPLDSDASNDVAAGDVDGDGDNDLVFGNGLNRNQANALLFNIGNGMFIESTGQLAPVQNRTKTVALEDLDGDGHLDLFFGNGQQDRFLVNDGTGTFLDVTSSRLSGNSGNAESIVVGDLDLDGDGDVVIGKTGANIIFSNTHRQLVTPFFPAMGQAYELRFRAQPGYGTEDHTGAAVLGFGLAAAPIPIPGLGTFYLDPAALVALPPVPIPAGSEATQQVPIPVSPVLVGVTLYFQAVIVNDLDPSDAQLTGHVAAKVVAQ